MAVVDWKNQSTADLATLPADLLGAPVWDRTGLAGRYAESGTDLASAVREQLGLRRVKTRAQCEVLVVDRVQRTPSEN